MSMCRNVAFAKPLDFGKEKARTTRHRPSSMKPRPFVPTVVKTLTRKYAHLRGEYDYAEREIEDVFGLDAIDTATARILKRKKEIHHQLDAVETVIHIFDPTWDFTRVRPIRPQVIVNKNGALLQAAYEVFRERNNIPMSVYQIARAVAVKLGFADPDSNQVGRFASKLTNAFMRKRDGVLIMLEGLPRRWMLRNFVPLSSEAFSANISANLQIRDVRPRRVAEN
jgi:hypothetical protein